MKKIFSSILVLGALFSMNSCDFLDNVPTNAIGSNSMWTNEELAEAGMAGLYRPLYKSDLTRTQIRMEDYDGLNRAGIEGCGFTSMMDQTNYSFQWLSNTSCQANDFQIRIEWKTLYTVVHACNDAIDNLHKAGLDEAKYNRLVCEAKLLRAFIYTRLNMLYGGVPIYDHVVTNEECTRVQSSFREVWEFIIKDCSEAIACESLPDNNLSGKLYGRPSKGMAYALRGMAYLWLASDKAIEAAYDDENIVPLTDAEKKDYYTKAVSDYDAVEACGYHLWNAGWADIFTEKNEKNSEVIFPLQFTTTPGFCSNWQMFIGGRSHLDGWQNVMPSPDFVDYYQKADGTKFSWVEIPGLEDWNKLTPQEREVFFLRDGLLDLDAIVANYDSQIIASTDQDEKDFLSERKFFYTNLQTGLATSKQKIGESVFNKYYRNHGNEARVLQGYADRDPRLQMSVIVPYTSVLAYYPYDAAPHYKQQRWPFAGLDRNEEYNENSDYYQCNQTSLYYIWKKDLVLDNSNPGGTQARSRCGQDWYLIRYTQILLQKAEALWNLERYGEARLIVDQIRSRAGMPATLASDADLMDAIRYESRVELCEEGVNLFEEIRWGTWKQMKFQGEVKNGAKNVWGDTQYCDKWYWKDNMWPWSVSDRVAQKNQQMKRRNGWTY